MLTETAAVLLKPGSVGEAGEDLAERLTGCGFPSKRTRGEGVRENVRKWREMAEKKEELIRRSRNRVAFAWTLVALCCGSHASHLLHSVGIHIAHGSFWEVLHDNYVKCRIAVVSLLGPGRDILVDGLKAMAKRSPNMNSLVGFGSIAAFFISAVSLLNPGLEWDASFFDEPVMLLGFVLLGRSLEEKARLRASSDMNELLSLVSSQSRLVITSSEGNHSDESALSADSICIEVPTDEVKVGDSVFVLPGETIPVNGKVLAGRSVVDESMLTGESLPVVKERGLTVSSGTINWDGPLRIEASTTGSMFTIPRSSVEDAQGHEAPIQRLADSIAGPFVYCVMTLSAATFAFWYYIGTNIFPDVLLNEIDGSDGNSLLLSLKLSVDVLGLLIRGDVLERLAGIDFIALDKTGTLTEGKPVVTAVASLALEDSEVLRLAAAVEKTAIHPIAKAIVNKAESLKMQIPFTQGQLTEPGFGSLAEVDGSLVAVGTLEWVHERFQKRLTESDMLDLQTRIISLSEGKHSKSVVYVGHEGDGVIGAIAVTDVLRHDAESTVRRLQQKGVNILLLSGDREETVASIGKMVGIEEASIKSSLTPELKSNFISSLKANGHRVAMIGDGINDAPSFALADVGVALQIDAKENASSDAASVVLLGNKLSQIVDALDLARATLSKVHQNLSWAVAYNIVSIPIAAGVLPQFDFAMTPSLSGGLMAMSSILVVTNSVLLQLPGSVGKRNSLFAWVWPVENSN